MPELVQKKPELLRKRFSHIWEQRSIVLVSPRGEAGFHFRFLGFLLRSPVLRSSAEMAAAADS
jgi:hypothetical protein